MKKPLPNRRPPRYLPTPEEIKQECAEIQGDWSDVTRRKRAGLKGKPDPYTIPVYRAVVSRLGEVVLERVE